MFDIRRFEEAKCLLLEIISSNQYPHKDYKLYSKLGDACKELNQYQEAQYQYEHSLKSNPSYLPSLLKLANLFHHHLDQLQKAELAYGNCSKFHPNNDECMYNYAILLEKQNKMDKAKKLYTKCLKYMKKHALIID